MHHVEDFRTYADAKRLRTLTYEGRGGTNFVPAIKEAATWAPDCLLYFTDLEGDAGDPPPFDVRWIVPQGRGLEEAPYGEIIFIDVPRSLCERGEKRVSPSVPEKKESSI